MTLLRCAHLCVEVLLSAATVNLRCAHLCVEVLLSAATVNLRCAHLCVEVLADVNANLRCAHLCVEVLLGNDPSAASYSSVQLVFNRRSVPPENTPFLLTEQQGSISDDVPLTSERHVLDAARRVLLTDQSWTPQDIPSDTTPDDYVTSPFMYPVRRRAEMADKEYNRYVAFVATPTVPILPLPSEVAPLPRRRDRRSAFEQEVNSPKPPFVPDFFYGSEPTVLRPLPPVEYPSATLGDIPREEEILADKWYTPFVLPVPPIQNENVVTHQAGYDPESMMLQEKVEVSSYTVAISQHAEQIQQSQQQESRFWHAVLSVGNIDPDVLTRPETIFISSYWMLLDDVKNPKASAGRPFRVYTDPWSQTEPTLIPESPSATSQMVWYSPLTLPGFIFDVNFRDIVRYLPSLFQVISPQFTAEFLGLNWHTPLSQPYFPPHRDPYFRMMFGLHLSEDEQAEKTLPESFGQAISLPTVLSHPPLNPSSIVSGYDEDDLQEKVFVDFLQYTQLPVLRRELQRAVAIMQSGELTEPSVHEFPLIARLLRAMLAAGFWRPRK